MLNNKDKASLRSYENRLENEHNDPEFIPQEECRHCDNLTEPNPKEGKECGECYNPYGLDEDETHEYHQNQISDLEKKAEEQAARIAELTRHRRQARESMYYWQGRHKRQAARIAELETELKLAPLKEQLDRFGKDIAAEQERIANLPKVRGPQ